MPKTKKIHKIVRSYKKRHKTIITLKPTFVYIDNPRILSGQITVLNNRVDIAVKY